MFVLNKFIERGDVVLDMASKLESVYLLDLSMLALPHMVCAYTPVR